ncbi:hypothetical protein [Streptomyces sp. NPDC093094]|uniref:hypothetical protein n=1 Tax=Streptomyces sp. NPDC093094 TaxID=3366026 RepID=UPI00381206DE
MTARQGVGLRVRGVVPVVLMAGLAMPLAVCGPAAAAQAPRTSPASSSAAAGPGPRVPAVDPGARGPAAGNPAGGAASWAAPYGESVRSSRPSASGARDSGNGRAPRPSPSGDSRASGSPGSSSPHEPVRVSPSASAGRPWPKHSEGGAAEGAHGAGVVRVPSEPAEDEPSRAGSRAGEGRQRPGRPQEKEREPGEEETSAEASEQPEPSADESDAGTADSGERDGGDGHDEAGGLQPPAGTASVGPTEPQAASRQADPPQDGSPRAVAPQAGTPAEPMLHVLPLGSGLMLVGLGLALAFLGLRLRRD